MKRLLSFCVVTILCIGALSQGVLAQELLIPVGQVIGLELSNDTVTVAAFDDAACSAKNAGIVIGDELVSIEGTPITCVEDVHRCLKDCGDTVSVTVRRDGKERSLRIRPEITADGTRLGVYLRQGITGIGTVTYYDPDSGEFGTLGHGVSDPEGGLLSMRWGNAYTARVQSVKKGKSGEPGQLRGNAEAACAVGTLLRNTPQGVFGRTKQGWRGEPLPVASYADVKTGPAVIRSTVEGTAPREYSVEILKIYPMDRPDCRNFLLKVTDPALLAATGGIVQGMSGSPIIQNGKLIGAVTHVLVNDPTTGYGIFIENMLDAAA